MRSLLLLLLTLTLSGLAVRADTIVVTGVLLDTDERSRASGYSVKIYLGKPGVGDASDSTSTYGVYTIVRENVDPDTFASWRVTCNQDGKVAFSDSALEFVVKVKTPLITIWQAKVKDLPLKSTRLTSYSPDKASEVILAYSAVQAIRAQSGEIKPGEANELASREAARVLGHTELGKDPEAALREINRKLRSAYVSNPNYGSDLMLPLLHEPEFMQLRNRPEFQNPILQPENPAISGHPGQASRKVCVCSKTGFMERCEAVYGRDKEELRAAVIRKVCGFDRVCEQSMEAGNIPPNIKIKKCDQD